MMKRFTLLLTVIFFINIFNSFSQNRIVTELREGWKFSKGETAGAHLPDFNDSGWQNVTVPHDWAIEGPFIKEGDGNTGKLPWKGEGWYRLKISRLLTPANASTSSSTE